MRTKKKIRMVLFCLCAVCVAAILGMHTTSDAMAEIKVIDNFKYTYEEFSPNELRIYRIEPISEQGISTLRIPPSIDGKKVVELEGWSGDGDTNIFGVYHLEDDGRLRNLETYNMVKRIKKIVLPDTLKRISKDCFGLITGGKSINIPAGLEKNVRALCGKKWKKVSISSGNKKYKVKDGLLLSRNGKTVYGSVTLKKEIRIPEGVKKIKEGSTFCEGNTTDIYIPSSVDKIGFQSLFFRDVVRYHVAKGNPHYAEAENCIYSKRTGRLVAACVRNSVFTVPSKVTLLSKTNFSGTKIEVKKFVIPTSVKKIDGFWTFYREKITYVFRSKKPPKIDKSFALSEITFYVPKGSREAYEWAVGETNYYNDNPVTVYEK